MYGHSPPRVHRRLKAKTSSRYAIRSSFRPVVPIEVLSQASREPKRNCEKVLPWLDDPESRNRDGEMPMVFSRQVDRWWEFLKWQIDNRGTPVGYDGFSAFFEAQKRRYTLLGSHAMVSNSTFEETVRRQWGLRPKLLEVPSNADFLAGGQETSRILQLHPGVLVRRQPAPTRSLHNMG
jgi:hypothetical protein